MANIASNRWIQLSAASIIAVVIGTAIGASMSTSEGSASTEDVSSPLVTERVLFTSGGLDPLNVIEVPITGEGAVAAGWEDPVLCAIGRGRYFTKGTATEEGEQYVLMFNRQNELIGLYNFAFSEMPPPWKKMEEISGPGGVEVVPTDHWGLFTYFEDPTRACKTTEAKEGSRPYLIH